jgi:hypothetical protein
MVTFVVISAASIVSAPIVVFAAAVKLPFAGIVPPLPATISTLNGSSSHVPARPSGLPASAAPPRAR